MEPSSDSDEGGPRLARRNPLSHRARLCPRCLNQLTPRNELGGWLIPQDYFCAKCGYSGSAFLERDSDSPQQRGA